MARNVYNNRRILLVLSLLCLIAYTQSAAILSAGEPHHDTGHCCLLCHIGSLPFLEMATSPPVATIIVV